MTNIWIKMNKRECLCFFYKHIHQRMDFFFYIFVLEIDPNLLVIE